MRENGKLRWYRVYSPSVHGTGGVFLIDPMDVLTLFPVRKSRKQKERFQAAVRTYAEKLGYQVKIEPGGFGVRNIVIGNPECAEYLITAHYDTCAALPFPNLITPCSLLLFLGWQLLLVLVLCVPVGILGGLVGYALNNSDLAVFAAYVLLLAEVAMMLVGPANRQNANDNTSGVVAVLETARALPRELRDRACFVLFDLEEAGLLGSASYRKTHREQTERQIVLNLDCVGEGDEILLFPTKKSKKRQEQMTLLRSCCKTSGRKSLSLREKGFSIYPSDQGNFPFGVGIAAFCRSKWAGLYLARIHTAKDRILDENNVALLRDFLITVVAERKKG